MNRQIIDDQTSTNDKANDKKEFIMKKTAAELTVYALEQLGITHTFGIPGVHNTELYDALSQSKHIKPILVTNEQGGSFIADGMSRVATHSQHFAKHKVGNIGTLVIVPAAGLTHAASGIGEAYLDGIPMLVLTGGIRRDTDYQYKLHDIDQLEVAKGFTKAGFRINNMDDVITTLYQAYDIATSGVPGPVLVEIPVDLQLFPQTVTSLMTWQTYQQQQQQNKISQETHNNLQLAVETLNNAKQVGLFVGYGARMVKKELIAISELLNSPVTTTLQGLSSFPHEHPLHAGFGFSPSAVPSGKNAIAHCDVLLVIGARFAEIPTGSFGLDDCLPQTLVHFDIDPTVIGANYPTQVGVVGDVIHTVPLLLKNLKQQKAQLNAKSPSICKNTKSPTTIQAQIAKDKRAYRKAWYKADNRHKVNPIRFFDALRHIMPADSITVLDDGNHTFLAAELYPVYHDGLLISPTDYNAMGYAAPAAIGAKLANPKRDVVAVVGDGCFTMTCMEILTAKANRLGILYCVFSDGELSQIAQAQQLPYQQKTCTILPNVDLKGVAMATGATHIAIKRNKDLVKSLKKAHALSKKGEPVIVDINIDYSKQTAFTKGTSQTTFKGFSTKDKLRFIKRIMRRKLPF